ncbi:hypothetical protein H1R20_g16141, partial [Candolleomyces eurysporus]
MTQYHQPYEGQYDTEGGECAAWEYTYDLQYEDPQYQDPQYRDPHYPQYQSPRYQYSWQYGDSQYSRYPQEQQHPRNQHQHQQAYTPSPNRHTDIPPSATHGAPTAALPREAQCYSRSESTNGPGYYQQEGNLNSNWAPRGERPGTYYETLPESPVFPLELSEDVDEERVSPQQPPEEFRRENTTTGVAEPVTDGPQRQENGNTSGHRAPAHLAESSAGSSKKGKEKKIKKRGSWMTSFFKRSPGNPNLDPSGGDSEGNDTKGSKSKSKLKWNLILGSGTK